MDTAALCRRLFAIGRAEGAVAAGLIVGTALKLMSALRASPMGIPACAVLMASAFVSVAILRWPLVGVLLGLGTIACLLAWRRLRGGNEVPLENG